MKADFKKYSDDIQIKRMNDAGMGATVIAKALGRSKFYVQSRLPEISFLAATNIDKILSLGRDGQSIKVIAQRTSSAPGLVVYHLRMNGIPVDDMDTIAVWLYGLGDSLHHVSTSTGYSMERLSSLLDDRGVERRTKESAPIDNERFFKDIDSPEKAYWLGFWCADGNVSSDGKCIQVKLHARDRGHISKFIDTVGYHGQYSVQQAVTNYGAYEYASLRITSRDMNADLVSHGCVPNKSKWLRPPTGVNKKLVSHFIRGMIDGDGSVVKRGGVPTGIKLYGVQEIVRWAAEMIPGARIRQHSGQTWEAQWNGASYIEEIYEGSSEGTRLDRKYDLIKEILS